MDKYETDLCVYFNIISTHVHTNCKLSMLYFEFKLSNAEGNTVDYSNQLSL